jgi:hypothetical protein
MKEVKLTTFEATPNSERKKKDIEFHKKMREWEWLAVQKRP